MSLVQDSDSRRWLKAPSSENVVRVRLIDNTGNLCIPSDRFLEPSVKGQELLNAVGTCYLIENVRLQKKAVFDLGLRKDWWNLAPRARSSLALSAVGVKVDKDIPEILQSNGIPLSEIDDIIWSHAHLDHTGDPSLFPPTTTLNYGKRIATLKPGYPEQLDSVLLTSDFTGRRNNEIDFSQSALKIGGFTALDFYGDGSFYLIDTPGHAPGHLCGLARTTNSHNGQGRDTFVLLAGDSCHFCGVLRPNETYPFPTSEFPASALGVANSGDIKSFLKRHHHFSSSNDFSTESFERARTTPWCCVSTAEVNIHEDPALAQATANRLREEFDEAANVFVALAHDKTLLLNVDGRTVLPTLNTAPESDLNEWFERGWKGNLYWSWVSELGPNDSTGEVKAMEPHVVGFWKDGKQYESGAQIIGEI
ncbi:metallo-beta-lactamase superfamily [Trichoderma arundinaceum]|uniref:Metallo-beta-lactamase superfamily n=1 Tax=Trichoderma arundinaceum TaxID=490622 RepID=A0A395NL73_TRIAR|nr:metallo-beta-lactamase superfamily [Trichoderma arundinaceum]